MEREKIRITKNSTKNRLKSSKTLEHKMNNLFKYQLMCNEETKNVYWFYNEEENKIIWKFKSNKKIFNKKEYIKEWQKNNKDKISKINAKYYSETKKKVQYIENHKHMRKPKLFTDNEKDVLDFKLNMKKSKNINDLFKTYYSIYNIYSFREMIKFIKLGETNVKSKQSNNI